MHITHWNVVAVHGQGLFFSSEGRLLVILLHESCTLIFVLRGNHFIICFYKNAYKIIYNKLFTDKLYSTSCLTAPF